MDRFYWGHMYNAELLNIFLIVRDLYRPLQILTRPLQMFTSSLFYCMID
jgi:hypothetical protein